MNRLCVFYKDAWKWLSKEVEWIVCKECKKALVKGKALKTRFRISSDTCPTCNGSIRHGECSKCGYCGCSFDPVNTNDYCLAHKPI